MKNYVADSYKLFIGGRWVDSASGKTFDVYNPGGFKSEVQHWVANS